MSEFAAATFVSNVQKNPPAIMYTQADLDRVRAEGRAAGLEESLTDGGLAAAHAHVRAVLELPEAQGRRGAALHIAATSKISIEAAKGLLAIMPTEASALRSGGSHLGLVINNSGEAS